MSVTRAARLDAHSEGRGCAYAAARRPVQLAYSEPCDSLAAAVEREGQIKRWSGRKKAALAAQNTRELRSLSRRRKYARNTWQAAETLVARTTSRGSARCANREGP